MTINLKQLGEICKESRIEKGYLQSDIANQMHYSIENISAFENGKNNNAQLLLWYIRNGLDLEKLWGCLDDGNNTII